MFEQTFKNIDDVLWKEAGCTTELDYTEQTSWLLFLKYLDDLEKEREMEAELKGESYEFILDELYRWSYWAVPKLPSGEIDRNHALTGDDLIEYVNNVVFPYLQGFKQRAASSDTIEYKIGEIFGEIKNKFQSGYSLRDALEYVDELQFQTQDEKHELSHLYETKIKNMGNAGRNGGEYYTPRPLIRAMIQVVKPKIGERIYDGACGSAGFLCESYDYLRQGKLTTSKLEILQTKTFVGKEKKSLAYVMPEDVVTSLNYISRRQGTTLFIILLTALKILLFKWSGQTDILVVATIGNRSTPEIEPLLGCFINNVIVYSKVEPHLTATAFIEQVDQTLREAINHKSLPFQKVIGSFRNSGQDLPISAGIVMAPPMQMNEGLVDCEISLPMEPEFWHEQVPLEIGINYPDRGSKTLEIGCVYNTDVFSHETIKRLFSHYRKNLQQLIDFPESKLFSFDGSDSEAE